MKQKFSNMFLKRRFCKRILLALAFFGFTIYISVLLFGDFKTPKVMVLTNLNKCPACYGVSLCPELYSNQIMLDSDRHWTTLFNAKNIYYGQTKFKKRVVLKKLAHDWELEEFDSLLCERWNLKSDCKPGHLLNVSNIEKEIADIVKYNFSWPVVETRKGLIMCPYPASIFDVIKRLVDYKGNFKSDLLNVWTMLLINPEPIVLQIIPKSQGWRVPGYGGVCGRLEVLAYEGVPLSSLTDVAWHRKLKFAKQILESAMDFTYKHERYRFYLMDWSLDNIVVNEKDDITFVDLEDIVLLDKHVTPKPDLPDWYKRYNRENIGPGFSFSIENMCKHHLSDHNLWAACYLLASDDNPLLLPVPKEVNNTRPHFERLLNECVKHDGRFKTVATLHHVIDDMLSDENIVGFGAVR